MICKNCGRQITDDALFCEYCGAKLETGESAAVSAVVETKEAVEEGAVVATNTAPEAVTGDVQAKATGVVEGVEALSGESVMAAETAETTAVTEAVREEVTMAAGDPAVPAPAPYAAAPMQQYSAPLPGQGQSPAATVPPYGAPVAPYGAYPQTPYQADPYTQGAPQPMPAPAKKKSKTWIVILIVALLVLCVGGSVAGYFIYTNFFADNNVTERDDTDRPSTTDDDDVPPATDDDDDTPPVSNDDDDDTPPISNDDDEDTPPPSGDGSIVLVDNEDLRITINAKNYEDATDVEWREYEATVENKTDEEIALFIGYDTVADGIEESYFIIASAADYSTKFPANKTTDALIVFSGEITGTITNFNGTFEIIDPDTYETIETYDFSVDSLG